MPPFRVFDGSDDDVEILPPQELIPDGPEGSMERVLRDHFNASEQSTRRDTEEGK